MITMKDPKSNSYIKLSNKKSFYRCLWISDYSFVDDSIGELLLLEILGERAQIFFNQLKTNIKLPSELKQ